MCSVLWILLAYNLLSSGYRHHSNHQSALLKQTAQEPSCYAYLHQPVACGVCELSGHCADLLGVLFMRSLGGML